MTGELPTEQRFPVRSDHLSWSSNNPRGTALLFHGLTAAPSEMAELGATLHNTLGLDVTIPLLAGHGTTLEDLRHTHRSAWESQLTACAEQIRESAAPVILIGMSFGSLLALRLLTTQPGAAVALVALAPLISLRKRGNQQLLHWCSMLPESSIDRLGVRRKKVRDMSLFSGTRQAYAAHSIGALARAWQLRRDVLARAGDVRCPVLLLQDPGDHHLSPRSAADLARALVRARCIIKDIPGAEHEMPIGPKRAEVFQIITEFLKPVLDEHMNQQGA